MKALLASVTFPRLPPASFMLGQFLHGGQVAAAVLGFFTTYTPCLIGKVRVCSSVVTRRWGFALVVLLGPRTTLALKAVAGGMVYANWPLHPGSIPVAQSRLSVS